jgi:hypothetical protein
MFPASSKGGGMCMGFPDVCKVPAPPAPFVPVPFPNMSQCASASKESQKVKIENMGVLTKESEMSMSNGDEPGTLGGMVSGVNMNKVTYKKGTSKVKAEGKDIVHITSMTSHNKDNFPAGMQIVPSQVKVIVGM